MSICTLGLYVPYWFYWNGQRIERRTGESLSPFWRAFFSPFWGFSFLDRVRTHAMLEGQRPWWDPGLLGLAYLLLSLIWRFPEPWWLLTLVAFVPLIPVVRTLERLNASHDALENDNREYSIANIFTLIFGGLAFLLVLIGTFLPAEGGV
jgi:hypothetical protein